MVRPEPVESTDRATLVDEFTHSISNPRNLPDEEKERIYRCCIYVQKIEGMRSYYTAYVQTGIQGEISEDYNGRELSVNSISITYGPDKNGWVGFDCNHYGDYCIGDKIEGDSMGPEKNIWTLDKVREKVNELCEELALNGY